MSCKETGKSHYIGEKILAELYLRNRTVAKEPGKKFRLERNFEPATSTMPVHFPLIT